MRIIFSVFLLLFVALTAASQSPAKIFKRAEAALGGAKAMRSVRTVQRIGEITRRSDGASGRVVLLTARPGDHAVTYDVGGFEVASGFNGNSAWTRDSRGGVRTLTGPQGLIFRAESNYRNSLWLDYKKDKTKIVAGGRVDLAGKPANVLTLKTAKGVDIKVFFDEQTGLPVREEFSLGGESAVYDYGDFSRVGALLQPYRITYTANGETLDIKLERIVFDEPVAAVRFDFPVLSTEPLPDVPTLLKEVQANEDRVEQLLESYAFTEKRVGREVGKDGVLIEKDSETSQVSFYKGFRINRRIEKNGKPLSESEQKDADRDAAKRVEQIEKIIAKRESGDSAEAERGERMSIAEILRASNLLNPRRERFRDRDVIVFDFEPNVSFDYKNAKSMLRFFGKTAGVIWIDAADKQVARVEAVLADSFNIGGGVVAKLKKGASFTLEQERVNNEIWLPSAADINLSVRVFLVKGINVNQTIRSYDYRKFKTEVNDARVNQTVKP
ncbi:MAG: hypothetical protein ABI791_08545 [Acidobacteriota bacterium]